MTSPVNRLDIDNYFLQIARVVSLRSTCRRRTVGCVLVNPQKQILSTGYNGGLPRESHCLDVPCSGATDCHGDTSRCLAVHAELNAVLQCQRRDAVHAVYCTDSPCLACARILCSLPRLKRVVYVREYTSEGLAQLQQRGIEFQHFPAAYDQRVADLLFTNFERTRNAQQVDVAQAKSQDRTATEG